MTMENNFIVFEGLTLGEAEQFTNLGFAVVPDADSRTVKIIPDWNHKEA